MKGFKKKIFLAVADRLSIYGFKKKGFSEIILKADNHTIQTLTFGMSSGGELHSVFVRPIISVTYKDAEKLFQQFGVLGAGRIGCNIGYLMPQNYYIEWRFNREEDPAVNLNEMGEVNENYSRLLYLFLKKNLFHYSADVESHGFYLNLLAK